MKNFLLFRKPKTLDGESGVLADGFPLGGTAVSSALKVIYHTMGRKKMSENRPGHYLTVINVCIHALVSTVEWKGEHTHT